MPDQDHPQAAAGSPRRETEVRTSKHGDTAGEEGIGNKRTKTGCSGKGIHKTEVPTILAQI